MTADSFLDGRVTLHKGDCRDVLAAMPDASVDSVVCDPPYGLEFMGKDWDTFKPGHKQPGFGEPDGSKFRQNMGTPSFTADGNPTCKNCGGDKYRNGDRKCRCGAPNFGNPAARQMQAFQASMGEIFAEALRVLKPGGHVVAFSGTRTYHRLAVAIEDAGFEIRDQLFYCYGSGFPKSHNIGKALDEHGRRCSCARQEGGASLLQHDVRSVRVANVSEAPAAEGERGEVLFASLSEQGASAGQVQRTATTKRAGKSRLEGRGDVPEAAGQLCERALRAMPAGTPGDGASGRLRDGAPASDGALGRSPADADGVRAPHRPQPAEQRAGELGTVAMQPDAQAGGAWPTCGRCGKPVVPEGLGTALKPAVEPIVLARKPLIGTVAANVLAHGTGAINVDACRIPTGDNLGGGAEIATTASQKGNEGWVRPWMKDDEARNEHAARVRSNVVKAETLGRFPANLIHDGSDEVLACFPDSKGQQGDVRGTEPSRTGMDGTNCYGEYGRIPAAARNDSGSAARFFYSSKADADDRLGSKHPTIKPVDLMQWLVRLVTPRGGTCLDPFAGTGTTGEAAWREGMNAILIEREPEYQADIARRMDLADKPRKRAAVARTKNNIREIGPLFTNIEAAE